jgi:hypothetical protein
LLRGEKALGKFNAKEIETSQEVQVQYILTFVEVPEELVEPTV